MKKKLIKNLRNLLKGLQQIKFIGKRLKNTRATMFFIIEKSEETSFNFSQNSATIYINNRNSKNFKFIK